MFLCSAILLHSTPDDEPGAEPSNADSDDLELDGEDLDDEKWIYRRFCQSIICSNISIGQGVKHLFTTMCLVTFTILILSPFLDQYFLTPPRVYRMAGNFYGVLIFIRLYSRACCVLKLHLADGVFNSST